MGLITSNGVAVNSETHVLEVDAGQRTEFKAVAWTPTGSGATTIVTGVAGKRIVVRSFFLVVSTAMSIKWMDDAADLCGAMPFPANGGISCPSGIGALLRTPVGNALRLNTTAAGTVGGALSYTLE